MGKVLIFLSIVILLIMSIGASIAQHNPVFMLASVTASYQQIRVVLVVVLKILFVTRPPRHVWIRAISGFIAIMAVVWTNQQTYSHQMLPLDILSILGTSIAIKVAALEPKAVKVIRYSLSNGVITV